MANFDPAVSSNITARPALAYDSDNGTSQITLNLTSIPANALGCYIYRIPTSYESGPMIPVAWRNATGTFNVTGLSLGPHWFIAVPHEADGKVGPVSNRVRVYLGTIQGLDTLLAHLETQLINLVWTTNPVFGVVKVTDDDPDELQVQFAQKPVALITLGDVVPSDVGGGNYPDLIRASIAIHIYTKHNSMDRGRSRVLGGNIPDEDGSMGKGIVAVRRKVRSELSKVTTAGGTRYEYSGVSDGGIISQDKQAFVSKMVMQYQAECYDGEA